MNTTAHPENAAAPAPQAQPEPPVHQPASAQAPAQPQAAPPPPFFDPRRRLRELLSVPERDRTDAQWDEIVELEIQTAPGNRIGPGPAPGGGGGGSKQPAQKKNFFKGPGSRMKRKPAKPPGAV